MMRNSEDLEELHCFNICDITYYVTWYHWSVTPLIVQPHLYVSVVVGSLWLLPPHIPRNWVFVLVFGGLWLPPPWKMSLNCLFSVVVDFLWLPLMLPAMPWVLQRRQTTPQTRVRSWNNAMRGSEGAIQGRPMQQPLPECLRRSVDEDRTRYRSIKRGNECSNESVCVRNKSEWILSNELSKMRSKTGRPNGWITRYKT